MWAAVKAALWALLEWVLGKISTPAPAASPARTPEQQELQDVEIAQNAKNNIDSRLARSADPSAELLRDDGFRRKD